jgi:hypothetical protein
LNDIERLDTTPEKDDENKGESGNLRQKRENSASLKYF